MAVDFSDDSGLLSNWWQGNWQSLYIADTQVLHAAPDSNPINQVFDDWRK